MATVITGSFVCLSVAGPGPCMNKVPHHEPPKNCVHWSTSGVPDRHDKPGRGDGE